MSAREPMQPIEGLKKPTDLPRPNARPRTLAPVPPPTEPAPPVAESAENAVASSENDTKRPDRPGDIEPPKATRPRKPRAERAATATRSASADTMKPVSVSVPFTLAESWRDRAKKDRASQVDVLLDALVAHQSELTALVAARGEKPTVSDGLFDRTPGVKGERFVSVSLRIKAGNLEVIDRLTERHGADSRSQLVAAALSAYLS